MKILHIIYDDIKNPWCGGGGAYRVFKVNENIAHNHEVTVLTGNFPRARNENINEVNYIRVGLKSSYLLSRLSFTLLVPFVIQKHQSDIVVNDCSYFAPCFADLYTKRPVVNVIHHLMGVHSFRIYPVFGIFPYITEKIFLKVVRNVITSSKRIKRDIKKRCFNRNVIDIPNGVSEDLFKLTPIDLDNRSFILFLGRIDIYMKGLDILVESFSQIKNKNVFLKIAGSGKKGDMKKLKKLIRDYRLEERIEFLGRVSERDKFELLRNSLFLVMPSRFEGWGITAVEANAAGKAVLGTEIKALSEAVLNGKTALLVQPGSKDKLAEAMDFLIENKELRATLGREGKARAKGFSWDFIASRQLEFYDRVFRDKKEF